MYKFVLLCFSVLALSDNVLADDDSGVAFVFTGIQAGSNNQVAGSDANIIIGGDAAKSLYSWINAEAILEDDPNLGGSVSIKRSGHITCSLKAGQYGCSVEVNKDGVAFPANK